MERPEEREEKDEEEEEAIGSDGPQLVTKKNTRKSPLHMQLATLAGRIRRDCLLFSLKSVSGRWRDASVRLQKGMGVNVMSCGDHGPVQS